MSERKRIAIPPNWVCVEKRGKNNLYRCPVLNSDKTQQCTFVGRASALQSHILQNQHIFETISKKEKEEDLNPTDFQTQIEQHTHTHISPLSGASALGGGVVTY